MHLEIQGQIVPCLCLFGAALLRASSPAQAHADPVVFAGTAAGMQEAQAASYQKEKKWVQDMAHQQGNMG